MADTQQNGLRTLFLSGDVMTGRGIDQIMPEPSDPRLFEPYVRHALTYVRLAERRSGPIPRPVKPDYIWGDALAAIERMQPDARIINLETAVTTSDEAWPFKGINYRMHPANIDCLGTACIDCCVLANNHTLDWGHGGLAETLAALDRAGIGHAGAGATLNQATAPAVIVVPDGRILVYAMAATSSGVPPAWTATETHPGIHLLPDLSAATAERLGILWRRFRKPGDLLIASIHWGHNWGYAVNAEDRRFARLLIDIAGADLVHGHSSHHPRPMEIYNGRLLLYGCGDLINDYEGIEGNEKFRGELSLLYFPRLAGDGRIRSLTMLPMRMRRFRLLHASKADAEWLAETLDRESRPFGCRISYDQALHLKL